MVALPNVAMAATAALAVAYLALPGLRAALAGPLKGAVALGLVSAFLSGPLLDVQLTHQVRLRLGEVVVSLGMVGLVFTLVLVPLSRVRLLLSGCLHTTVELGTL